METGKKVYNSPKLTIHGDVAEITRGLSSGDYTDAAFPIATAFQDLTFS
jgi:hypothetical protein